MELNREQKRLLLHFQWKLSVNASEAARKICEAYGERAIGRSTAKEWFAKFNAGNEELEDKARSGRPIEVDRQAVLNAIEETPSLTTRMLADDFDCDHTTIVQILHELGKVWKKTRWVPHELTEAQKTKRVNAAQILLNRQRRTPFLANQLITGDEKWISFKNPDPQHEWRSPGEKTDATPKKDFRHKKAMLCVFWSARGVEYWELLEQGQTVNSELYCRQLNQLNQRLNRRHRAQVVFLDDNAQPHRSHMTNAKITELGWDRVDHPPYSPDLAPSDFHLFRSLQHYLKGKRFENINEMQESLEEFFDSKDAEFYRRGIMKLPEKWEEVIEVDGEYFD
jgi:histone-lysine N-methyltransferase SETMAR